MENCVKYIRVSTDKQDENNQNRMLDEFIKKNNWNCIRTYRDHGKSAFNENKARPDFEKMLNDAKKREFQHIAVFDLDRFSRKPAEEVIDQVKTLRMLYGVEVNAVQGDEWRDLVNMVNNIPNMGFIAKPLGDFLEAIIVGFKARNANLESKKLSDRVKESKKFQKAVDTGTVGRSMIDVDLELIRQVLVDHPGWGHRRVASELGLKASTVYRRMKELK